MTCSVRENILKFDRPVPRYTSYPTAPHFQDLQNEDTYYEWLRAPPAGASISLYLHVPFCSKMCWYCGCHTKITQRYAPVEDYAHLMMREIDILAGIVPGDVEISHIHFGGGSPGLLRACDFEKIMQRVQGHFNISRSCEIAMEIDPRGISEGRVATYAKYGMNRVSLGVQDFDDSVLESVNRQQPFHLSYDATKLFRSYGIQDINIDLLYGLPHQTQETMRTTIEKALLLEPDRISLFGYAHVPWMKKHMRLIDERALPDKTLRYDLFEIGSEMLQSAGYIAIGIDHFAKAGDDLAKAALEGRLRRNFQGYTTDQSDALIGIGASSIGKFSSGYIQNAVAMPEYQAAILDNRLPARKFCLTSREDIIHAKIIEDLMCQFETNLEQFDLDKEYFDVCLGNLTPFAEEGFVIVENSKIVRITQQGRPLTRLIAAAFDQYYTGDFSTPRHAKAI